MSRKPMTVTDFLAEVSENLATNLTGVLTTEQDVWWYLAEQFDRLHATDKSAQDIMALFPIQMHEIEFEGRRSENSYVGARNPGIAVVYDQFMPVLSERFGKDLAEMAVAHGFAQYCLRHLVEISRIRLKYAVHFHNNCISSKSFRSADKWTEVIHSLGGE